MRLALLAVLAALPSFGGFMKVWQLDELTKAPVLAVCRVERVTPGPEVPPGTLRWRTATRGMTATLTVLRSLPVIEQTTVVLHFYAYGNVQGGITGGDAIWPTVPAGTVRVFPLTHASGQWRLYTEEGLNSTLPAIAPPRAETPSKAPYDFLIGEFVNSLCWGKYRDIYDTATALREWPAVPAAIMPLLKQNIASDAARWADLAACALANLGIPRQPLAEIRAADPPRFLWTLALRQLPEAKYKDLIITRLVEHSDIHEWGSAVTLQEFATTPLVLRLLSPRLAGIQPGTMYIASWMIQADAKCPVLPVALDASFKALRSTSTTWNDRYAAVQLLIDHGTDAQFTALLDLFRASRIAQPKLYRDVFSAVQTKQHARSILMVETMLDDKRTFAQEMRFCDVAVGALQHLSKQDFGVTKWNASLAERNAALARAIEWSRRR